jgi:hypothetical protein
MNGQELLFLAARSSVSNRLPSPSLPTADPSPARFCDPHHRDTSLDSKGFCNWHDFSGIL